MNTKPMLGYDNPPEGIKLPSESFADLYGFTEAVIPVATSLGEALATILIDRDENSPDRGKTIVALCWKNGEISPDRWLAETLDGDGTRNPATLDGARTQFFGSLSAETVTRLVDEAIAYSEMRNVTIMVGAEAWSDTSEEPWIRDATMKEVSVFRDENGLGNVDRWESAKIDGSGQALLAVTILSDIAPDWALDSAKEHLRILRLHR